MSAYYNEFDPAAAEWLRWLIAEGLIAPGIVDQRSITEVEPNDLRGFTQCHFFAGIGGWSHAARLAGWPDDRPLWTGSCPCQPFSAAGKGRGTEDPRHLWPDLFRLARARKPPVLVGEQVAGAAGYGWFDGVSSDLESEGYSCRAVDIPACAVDAPHIRSRLYWVAVASAGDLGDGLGTRLEGYPGDGDRGRRWPQSVGSAPPPDGRNGSFWSDGEWIACHDGKARRSQSGLPLLVDGISGRVAAWRGFGNAIVPPLAAEVLRALT